MELIYRAWDGTEFDERSACEKYEYDNPCIPIYHNTDRTSKSDEAFVVVLRNDNDAEKFIELCEEQGTMSDGITKDCHGLYAWADIEEKYFYISDRIGEALKKYFED